jgi:formylglycine-generating enzyme required for sulfatase activity
MTQKLLSIILMSVLPMVIFAFAEDEAKTPTPSDAMQKQLADAIKIYDDKKETYLKDVLDLFERKEKEFRDKGDLKMVKTIKKEKDLFIQDGKGPTLFFITDQKRYLELAKLDLIKGYEKTIKDCIKLKLDAKAEEYSRDLKDLRTSKNKAQENAEIKKEKAMPLEALFSTEEAKAFQSAQEDAIKIYEDKKETYLKDVLDLFERKEKEHRDKADLKMLNLIKKEKNAFIEEGKEPTLFFITDQKRYLEIAKLDLIKGYEKAIKDCIKMNLDVEAEKYSKELEEIKTGKINVEKKKAKPIFLEAPFSTGAAKNAQMELAKSIGKVMEAKIDLGRGVKLEMVLIPAGKFMMGSPASEPGRQINENQHEVTLTKPFYIGKYEVTQEQWERVMGNNPSNFRGPRLPVTNVSWDDCQDFIKKFNAKTNSGYRLPTEAEWEYACRAGTNTAYSVGDKIIPADANYNESGKGKAITVGSYKPNGFGLYDMHGNVWEWCEDYYISTYPVGAVTDPKGPGTGISRALRGGSFYYFGYHFQTRSSFRIGISPSDKNSGGGFRLARTI